MQRLRRWNLPQLRPAYRSAKGGRCGGAPSSLRAYLPKGTTGSPPRRLQRPIADTTADLQGEWDAEKHGRLRRQWRKLHLAVDDGTGEIAAHLLTEGHADDAAQVPALLGQAEGVIASVTADGAYDGEPTYAAVVARQRHPPPDVVVPPRSSAVPSADGGDGGRQSPRDRHIQLMTERGRMGWQRATGYGRRNLVKTAMARYKHLIGPKLRARSLPAQQGEIAIAVAMLNTMIRTAKPVPVRVT